MKLKSLLLASGLCLLLMSSLTGCVAAVGPEYGYYPPAPRVYYQPRPVIVAPAPYYRPAYRPYRDHDGYRGGNAYRGGYEGGGAYRGRRR